MTAQARKIIQGPSKFDLMTALFMRGPNRPTIELVDDQGTTHIANIVGVESEDGSGESWNIKGWIKPAISGNGASKERDARFKAWFRTDTRKGRLEFV